MQMLYDAAGGMDGIRRLAHAWHERVLADEVVSHAFSHGFGALHNYFAWPTRGAMARYPASKRDVPESLGDIPRWTWTGPAA